MQRAVVLAAVLSLTSCNFAVKHPAITAGIMGGTIALGSCELAASDQVKCFEVGGGAGVGLAVIAAVALWLGYEDDDTPVNGATGEVNAVDPTNLAPAPVFVPKAPPPDAGAPPPPPSDATPPAIDAP